ncbi:hypothetical protein PCANC_10773 [Puccinia coronata f. sp. avenae]|uniref:Uncharacterized protein n=1 Tax=Puccinia coronata f. sp. avenae TaxID=200324 RepID=A0A2N5VST0_9BASI|nr:hypothetical protein PCANC_10773 [Puccinia coronata f. sp. avenae]
MNLHCLAFRALQGFSNRSDRKKFANPDPFLELLHSQPSTFSEQQQFNSPFHKKQGPLVVCLDTDLQRQTA